LPCLKDALKFWNRLTVIADIPEGTSIEVYYAVDGEDVWDVPDDFNLLGEITPEQVSDTGEAVLMFPDGLVAKSIQLVFNFYTTDDSKSPRLRAYNVETAVRQIPVDAHTFKILLAENVERLDKTIEIERTAEDMWEELKRARAKDQAIVVSFPNETIRGFISHLSAQTWEYRVDGMTGIQWEKVANVAVVEAT
jgi:hypothetical protein